jgi:hypothetical protein
MLAPTLKQCAKIPEQITLLLNIGNGVCCLGRKGKLIMGHIQALEILSLIALEQDIRWQLLHNHYPPVPEEMIHVAVKTIRLSGWTYL